MDKVDQIRDALLETLDINKVYLIYMDETNHVHWHLVPRYNDKGYNLLKHDPDELEEVGLARKVEHNLVVT